MLVLLHSPLVGPSTWKQVAARLALRGHEVSVPDLTPALSVEGSILPAIADLVPDRGAVLVGHSGAGPLLPAIARQTQARAVVYADSLLPYPGGSWLDSAPRELVEHLRALVRDDGRLPPWHEWFPAGTLDSLLPDPAVRAGFVTDLPRLPWRYFTERTDPQAWTGPGGYLLLSDGYREPAEAARAAGLPVVELPTHHLAMLTHPDQVADALALVVQEMNP
ncbi:alpha/beta hydrolase [Virgisporangium aliadipatigenens]|uniref:Alpha/beta hydrolase n=1 Tax=Virgisporangium aliadipatigenens TaxID=741659 RepID=A0A8J3YLT0_9ACTN|nr:alpha/beta fold hydrolase [Virgisporangium aliadipatigenens]GIJ46657.1 alpha/beta hydrolase [Virgisporangium aliadipatigenens]